MQDIKIIYEDKDLLVLNKPRGLMVHGDGRSKEKTLSDFLVEKYPGIKNVGEPWTSPQGEVIYRPGVVHRLDKDTTGVLIVAKNQETFEFLKKQFQEREIKKTYRAIVFGNIKENDGVIDRPIGRSSKDFRMWSAMRGARGEMRDAVTEFKVLKRFEAINGEGEKETFTYLEAYPKTGRTHQIRVHMKAISHPIVCDNLYAGKRKCALGLSNIALHSYSIEFEMPNRKKTLFEALLPEDFEQALSVIA